MDRSFEGLCPPHAQTDGIVTNLARTDSVWDQDDAAGLVIVRKRASYVNVRDQVEPLRVRLIPGYNVKAFTDPRESQYSYSISPNPTCNSNSGGWSIEQSLFDFLRLQCRCLSDLSGPSERSGETATFLMWDSRERTRERDARRCELIKRRRGNFDNEAQNRESQPDAAKQAPRLVITLVFRLLLKKSSREGLIVSPFFQQNKIFTFAVYIGGRAEWAKDPDMSRFHWGDWLIGITPPDLFKQKAPRARGYRTIRDRASQSNFKWEQQRLGSKSPTSVNGAAIAVTQQHTYFVIATLEMSEKTKNDLNNAMRPVIDQHRIDKIPTILSIYQYAVLFQRKLAEKEFRDIVKIIGKFDISETSPFRKAFNRMVKKKATGAGDVLQEKEDIWEWELYEQVEHHGPDVILEKSLDRQNRDILEDLWNKVHGDGLITTLSHNMPLPDTSPQNPSVPATPESQHPPLPAWALKEQDVYTDPRWKHRENWPKDVLDDWPSDPSGHH
ncbi:hypothetical protein EV360DRAFT_73280 [Lentinula raphanica]|nr:hypothetical protein EV360DRAFT_73280 [Lentinula raphanica]